MTNLRETTNKLIQNKEDIGNFIGAKYNILNNNKKDIDGMTNIKTTRPGEPIPEKKWVDRLGRPGEFLVEYQLLCKEAGHP